MKGDMVMKIQMLIDGDEADGLISLDEYTIEDGVVNVPGRDKTVPVRDGVKKLPGIPAVFKIKRNSAMMKLLEDWYYKKEYHDVTIIKTDGAGREYARELWPNTENSKCNGGGYNAESPDTAKVMVNLLPEDITPVTAEG